MNFPDLVTNTEHFNYPFEYIGMNEYGSISNKMMRNWSVKFSHVNLNTDDGIIAENN
jgi:hypothetical protein